MRVIIALMALTYRWLGVAGLELDYDGYRVLIDPFFTRPRKQVVLVNARVRSNAALVAQHVSRADAVFVTHAHYDHLLDVPEVLRITGARAYGSRNTCRLLAASGIPAAQIGQVGEGDRLESGPFVVSVYPARHTRIPMARLLNGPFPRRLRKISERGPGRAKAVRLRLSDYRMDACYSFRIQVAGTTLLVGNYPIPAEVLFIAPYNPGVDLTSLFTAIHPREVVPIHWDDFMRPLALPIKPMLMTPAQGLSPAFPPLRRLDLQDFTRKIRQILPGVNIRVPEIFQVYSL